MPRYPQQSIGFGGPSFPALLPPRPSIPLCVLYFAAVPCGLVRSKAPNISENNGFEKGYKTFFSFFLLSFFLHPMKNFQISCVFFFFRESQNSEKIEFFGFSSGVSAPTCACAWVLRQPGLVVPQMVLKRILDMACVVWCGVTWCVVGQCGVV